MKFCLNKGHERTEVAFTFSFSSEHLIPNSVIDDKEKAS